MFLLNIFSYKNTKIDIEIYILMSTSAFKSLRTMQSIIVEKRELISYDAFMACKHFNDTFICFSSAFQVLHTTL